ncbi:DUF2163 domain-containing protein [Burkholderia stagnalis]|uniref:DUF2163 domain-containing protein n=1 Tax=Burkholderia stagnalis TaxID=1503054 RepID=UPI000F80BE09|nr:DUF2163 domain-containing protein [Burkholderia stagnalis]
MRTISPALLAHLQGDVRTIATLWKIARTDGAVFTFTDHDAPLTVGGYTYQSAAYTSSAIDTPSDMSVSNLEVQSVFDSASITQYDLDAGLWNSALVTISLCNFMNLAQGTVPIASGILGQVKILNGRYQAELRGTTQIMQQGYGDHFQPTCRATFGDSKCTINLAPLTFTGSVQAVSMLAPLTTWNDSTLTQSGPVSAYTDTRGQIVPTTTPFLIQVVPPDGGAFASNTSVTDIQGNVYTQVSGSPGGSQYSVTAGGLYTFNSSQAGQMVFISYSYTIGYFAYGKVKWLTGLNAGYAMEVRQFAPGVVTLALPMEYAIQVGDTYQITAGCDKQFGTCKARWNNVIHFRGEPYIPGIDMVIRPQVS